MDKFSQYLIDICRNSLEMECRLIGMGYTSDRAREKTQEVQEYKADEAITDRFGSETLLSIKKERLHQWAIERST